jgi:hypothetical protein
VRPTSPDRELPDDNRPGARSRCDGRRRPHVARKCRAPVLTRSPHGFFTKLFHHPVNTRRERACSKSVSLVPRAGLELFSAPTAESP